MFYISYYGNKKLRQVNKRLLRCNPNKCNIVQSSNVERGVNMYSDKVMDHFSNPRNVGEIENADGVGQVGNSKCGDIMKIYLKIEDEIIVDVKFKTFGCGAAVATSSMATELIKGKTVDEALKMTDKAVVEALDGLPPAKLHCSVLAEGAVLAAINDYKRKKGQVIEDEGCQGCCGGCGSIRE